MSSSREILPRLLRRIALLLSIALLGLAQWAPVPAQDVPAARDEEPAAEETADPQPAGEAAPANQADENQAEEKQAENVPAKKRVAADAAAGGEDDAQQGPVGHFLTLESPIDDRTIGRVKNAALALQETAVRRDRDVLLVLEVTDGTSQFHHVYALADFLTSAEVSRVKTAAWVPETVTGNNVIVALACREIILHPDAQLGDIGRGKALPPEQASIVLGMVAKRNNAKVNSALAEGMLDPQVALLQLTVEPQPGQTEKRIVTEREAERLRNNNIVIRDSRTLKESGTPGIFSGRESRAADFLAAQTAVSRSDVADLYNLPFDALRESPVNGGEVKVTMIEVKGMIDPLLESFLMRQIERAVASGANTIIFEVDSPGGLLVSSENLASAIADLAEQDIRTVAYIPRNAFSGAAILSLGCDEIYLHPGGRIGDAGPIEIREGGQFERAPEKILSVLRETMKELGERKHRPSALLMAMADVELEVYEVRHRETGRIWYMTEDQIHESNGEWIKGRLVPESARNLLLTVDGERAHELKLAQPPVVDFEELKSRLGVPSDVSVRKIERTWLDDTVFILNDPWVVGLLFAIGLFCIYLELHLMSGLLGIIAVICFALFFWSKVLGGTAGTLEVVLFLIGLGCLAIEIFVIPGFGVFGLFGIVLTLASLVMASQTFGNMEPTHDLMEATRTLGTLGASVVGVIIMASLVNRFLPRIPLLKEMILVPPGSEVTGDDSVKLRPDLVGSDTGYAGLIGQAGVTVSALRPSGKALIDDRMVEVVSEGPYIPHGSDIEVVRVAGNEIIVREVRS